MPSPVFFEVRIQLSCQIQCAIADLINPYPIRLGEIPALKTKSTEIIPWHKE
jgi:hypothetical protein